MASLDLFKVTRINVLSAIVMFVALISLLYYQEHVLFAFLCESILVLVLYFVFIIAPFSIRLCPEILRRFIFVPRGEIPRSVAFEHPEAAGFVGARNFYLTTDDGARLGVWHVLPAAISEHMGTRNLAGSSAEKQYSEWLAGPGATVWLYVHGNAGSRASSYRLRLYRTISKLDHHLVSFDYRGYGDSTSTPMCESDLVNDTLTVYRWMLERVTSGNIYIWGHSLGSGVASHVAHALYQRNEPVRGLVLEAPFDNMAGAVRAHPLTKVPSIVPWFDYCVIKPLALYDMSFSSDAHLRNIPTRVLILHSRCDNVTPYSLAENLYNKVKASRRNESGIQMFAFEKHFRYGHYNITLDPNLKEKIKMFVDNTQV